MKVNAETGYPIQVHFIEPRLRGADGVAGPDARRQDTVHTDGDQRDPTRKLRVPARCKRGEHAAQQENDNQPDQNHKNNTKAIKSTDPTAMAAAYQRTRPVSVLLSPR